MLMDVLSFSNGRDVHILADPTMGIEYLNLSGTYHLTLRLMTRKFKSMMLAIQTLPNTYILGLQLGEKHYTVRDIFKTPTLFGDSHGIACLTVLANDIEYKLFYSIILNEKVLYSAPPDMCDYIREQVSQAYMAQSYFKMAQHMTRLAIFKEYTDMRSKLETLYNGDVGSIYLAFNTLRAIGSFLDSSEKLPYSRIESLINTFNEQSGILTHCLKPDHEAFLLRNEITSIRRTPYLRESMAFRVHELQIILSRLLSYYTKRFLIQNQLYPRY